MITQDDLNRFTKVQEGGNTPTLVIGPTKPVQADTLTTPLTDATRQAAEDKFDKQQELAATPISTALAASVRNWDTVQIANTFLNRPNFEDYQDFKPDEALKYVSTPITSDDRDFLYKAKSQSEFDWRLSQLQDIQSRTELAQTSPLLNTVVQFADPVYLAADLLSAGAGTLLKAGRLGAGALGAATTFGVQQAAGQSRPVTDAEVLMAAALHGAGTMLITKKAPTPRDVPPKPISEMTPEEFAAWNNRGSTVAADPNAASSPLAMAGRVGIVTEADDVPKAIQDVAAQGLRDAQNGVQRNPKRPWLEFSLFKTMAGYGEEGNAFATRLLDDPLQPNASSAASIHRETLARNAALLNQYEDTLQASLAQQGWGQVRRFTDPVGYRRAQQDFESAVRRELDNRMINPEFKGADLRVAQATDRLGEYSRAVGRDLERNGLVEPGFVEKNPYYYPRRMNVTAIETAEATIGKKAFMKGMTTAVQKGIQTDRPTANAIAYAMVERARRKGYGIDNSGHIINAEGRQELLDIIKTAPDITDEARARASALLQEGASDAGRAPMLKNRINIDMFHDLGGGMQVRDLFDDSISSMMDSYNRRISGRLALHQVGLGDDASRADAIAKLSRSIRNPVERRQAVKQAEDIMKYFLGQPVGEEMNQFMRNLSALTQATGLAASGLWQLVEYGTMMQRYGALNVFKAALRNIPEARALYKQMKTATKEGRQLALDTEEVLTAQVAGDIRMRPILEHYEDMFAADKSPWIMRMEQLRDATMFINMQKYIHFHQTRTNAALVVQSLRKASEGDAAAIKAMRTYGANDNLLGQIRGEVAKHGTKLEDWDEGVFNGARRVMMNSMDDAIVRARIGEVPAFAEFSTLGKFLFTFRKFVAATHNKTLVGTIQRDGAKGLATLMAYQYPLTMMATAANNVISGKGFDESRPLASLAAQSLNYMGAIGWASELTGVISGQQRSFGAPGLLFADRVYGIASSATAAAKHAATGDTSQAEADLRNTAGNTLQALPLISIVPGVRALTQAIKE